MLLIKVEILDFLFFNASLSKEHSHYLVMVYVPLALFSAILLALWDDGVGSGVGRQDVVLLVHVLNVGNQLLH